MAGMTCVRMASRTTSSPAMLKPALISMCGLMRGDSEAELVRKWVVMERSVVPPPMSMEAMRTEGFRLPSSVLRSLPYSLK